MGKEEIYEKSDLYKLRHTASHVLAMAAKAWDPKVKLAIGPPIENGFYYDFEFTKPVTDETLYTLDDKMREIIKKDLPVEHKKLPRKEALEGAKSSGQEYKHELMEDLPDAELGFYGIGDFWDLCKGPHAHSTGEIKAFKLTHSAGAYWRGDEHNQMLTRIYGTAFENKKDLEDYLTHLEEAKKRDHKKLGPQLDLFVFSDLVGAGLPLWTPKGTILRNELDNFVWRLRESRGYEKVEIPHIAKKDLYIKSGHWDKFKDNLFLIKTREGHEFAMKPMNCPHHTQIYASRTRSYRDLPVRYANTTMCYRDEQTGELSGLSRTRGFTQDDAHVFCRKSQIEAELSTVWDIVNEFYGEFGFKLSVHLSMSDPKEPEKYLGSRKVWNEAEDVLRHLAKKRNAKVVEDPGEAAFYGPKIDFLAEDSLGRSWQVATIQLDFNMPHNFDLTCINEEGQKEDIVMIHAAIMGSLERFLSILIEHTAGEFPTWLSPVQARVLPISDKFIDYAREVANGLRTGGKRAEVDESNETLGKKIRTAEMEKIPFLLIVGEKEQQHHTVTVRTRHTAEQSTLELDKFLRSF
ncbi:threonine--tRNA ligase [Candidatus Berkelbacteria bacterium RIFCSPLOWO2_01_FULL_50_28]|uniref:Threonine--tRNA ligase n=1 Tax=Candidatus Berkelbacteria bacterium RIFCSPLOWO2_01_FULL_50_28 TaxID=1797471 RepID=A0A1F5ECC5_9BACT|nr:MAG: threonine--tRNA ligase [Candidatus Berkelbacteria bacterium RIFCSPHIGHO2_01_FULL_50_36]OGD63784.1 MAG: threonine--tRNA ligase [Candidatus Berkelbacteria bacterium RIFCSPHIGHO2_12_FULL_50_11]OGD65057.1 MAG: threonine--tRNA ligase [Candidatus Berkelbacteria bacterium RIFCSPLOWO2_01_FULL_50_28]